MPHGIDAQPSAQRWHAVGLTAYLAMLILYAAAAWHSGGDAGSRVFWVLGGAATVACVAASIGRWRGWQQQRGLLIAWAVASLSVTTVVGLVDPAVTSALPGTITITFAYAGLTCRRGRSLALVPLGIVAFVVGGAKDLPDALPMVVVTAIMWVLVAEVPAWLISRLEAQSVLLRTVAETDALTHLLNRTTLPRRLSEHASTSAVVLIDLDGFKPFNDRHGHAAGDQLLVAFADVLRGAVGDNDLVFRIGGDEFLLILVGADRGAAEKLLGAVRMRWSEAGEPVGFSVGIATGDNDPMRIADHWMYVDKRSRRLPGQ